MNKIYIIILLSMMMATAGYSQTRNEAPSTNLQLPTYNIFNDSRYTIKAQAINRYVSEYTLMKDKNEQNKKTFTLNPNTVEGFVANFNRVFGELAQNDTTIAKVVAKAPGELSREATRLYYVYMISERAIETAETAPDAGTICFENNVNVRAETISPRQMRKKMRALKRYIRKEDLCDTTIREAEDSVALPCSLEKINGQTRRDWINEVRQFWSDHKMRTVQTKLGKIHSDFSLNQRRINEFTTISKADSISLILLLDKLKNVRQASAETKLALDLTRIQIGADSLFLLAAAPQHLPRATKFDYRDWNAVQGLFSLSAVLNAGLAKKEDSLKQVLRRISVQLNDTVTLQNVDSILRSKNVSQAELMRVQDRRANLNTVEIKVSNIYANRIKYDRQLTRQAEMEYEEQHLVDAISKLQFRLLTSRDSLNAYKPKKDSLCSQLLELRKKQPIVNFNATNISLDFNDGFIENIQVQGVLDFVSDGGCPTDAGASRLKFSNYYPFGFSRKMDYNRYKNYELHAIDKNLNKYALPVRYLMPEYFEKLETDRRDYSPKDDVVNVDFKTDEKCAKLQKDATFKLFEAKVYTDFVGLADDREPNGLVQTEIARRVFLNTYRYGIRRWASTIGVLGYIEPEVTISKIENNNRRLLLDVKDRFENSQYTPLKYSTTLELRRYQSFTAGLDINVFSFDWALMKSTFYIDGGFRYGRTPIRDSLRTADENQSVTRENLASDFGVNTTDIYPKITWVIRSDERYCFSFSWSHHWYYLRDNRFSQVGNGPTFNVTENQLPRTYNEYSKIGLYCTINTGNERGQIFARYHYFWQQGFWRTGFHQAQIGYSFYIFGVKRDNQ